MTQLSTALRLPSTARGQRTRQKLVEAAEAEFAQLGYERASVSGITGRARVAQGTFYVYFPDKKSIFVELVDSLGARLRQRLADAAGACPDRLAVERAGLTAFLAFTGSSSRRRSSTRSAIAATTAPSPRATAAACGRRSAAARSGASTPKWRPTA